MRLRVWRGLGPRCSACAWLGLAAALLAAGAPPAAADGAFSGRAGGRSVPWSYAAFQAERLGSRVPGEIWVAERSSPEEQAAFLQSPRGKALQPSGPEVVKLSIRVRIDLIGERQLLLENHLWFDPREGTPLYLLRTRQGLDDYYQQFRFTREGVFRRQREPASAAEAARPPESWSKLGEHFYALPTDERDCQMMMETSTLIYLLSVLPPREGRDIGPLCVFHKRQFHRVSLESSAVQGVGFHFVEKKADITTPRSGTAPARLFRIQSKPIGSYRGDVEDFFRDGTALVLSLDGGLPLKASCELPLIGRVDLDLREIHLK